MLGIKRKLAFCAMAATAFLLGAGSANADDRLDEIFRLVAETNQLSQASQVRIDQVAEETADLLSQYKILLKEIEGLRVYNAQLQRQIDGQNKKMNELRTSIEQVTLIERQITPLMIRMIDGLEQFVALDVPFLLNERDDRISTLREMMDRDDVSPSEKFRRVFEAYQIEGDYGRTIETYRGTLGNSGQQVDFLRWGRVAFMYQSLDGETYGVWNKSTKQWEELDDSYGKAVSNGIRIASAQIPAEVLLLPIPGPEKAQ